MAIYNFETITDAQAAAFTGADTLIFGQTGETAGRTTVRYNAATATSTATITITSGLTGKSATFAPAVSSATATRVLFTDGSTLAIDLDTAGTSITPAQTSPTCRSGPR
jgi:hypothetical protein